MDEEQDDYGADEAREDHGVSSEDVEVVEDKLRELGEDDSIENDDLNVVKA